MPMRSRIPIGVVLWTTPIACTDAASLPRFETTHLIVESYDEDTLCQGTLDDMDAQVERVAAYLGQAIPYQISVYYGGSAVDAFCHGMSSGCAWGPVDDSRIAADYASVMHELVHGVRSVNDVLGNRFFEEGLAEVLGGTAPTPYSVSIDAASSDLSPATLANLSSDDFDYSYYPSAAHFMSWLLLDVDEDATIAFLDHPDYVRGGNVEGAFEASLGVTLEEAEAAWRTGSMEEYSWGTFCDPASEIAWNDGIANHAGRLHCDEHDTVGPFQSKLSSRCSYLTTSSAVDLVVEFEARGGQVMFVRDDCVSGGAVTPEHYHDKTVAAGGSMRLPFAACRWRVLVRGSDLEPMTFNLRISEATG